MEQKPWWVMWLFLFVHIDFWHGPWIVVFRDLVKQGEDFTLVFLLLLSSSGPHVLTLTFSPLLLLSHTHPHTHILTLVIMLPHLCSLAFCLSLSHIAYLVKFNYLNPLVIGRVTHPLTPLSSTSSSVIIMIVFIIIDTSVSMGTACLGLFHYMWSAWSYLMSIFRVMQR